jgi:TonB family protein
MKSFIIFVLFALLFAGCEKKPEIQVIPNYNEIYLPPYKVDTPVQLIKGDTKGLYEKIDSLVKKSDTTENVNLEYVLYVNEKGNVNKIKVEKGPNNKYTDVIVNTVKDWKFDPAEKDGKAVKSQYKWAYDGGVQTISGEPINVNDYALSVSRMAQPIGGIAGIEKVLRYPELAKRAGVEGKVYVKAFINENGDVDATEILKGAAAGLDEAAEKAISETKFKPGMQDGKPVKVQVVIPIFFKLN